MAVSCFICRTTWYDTVIWQSKPSGILCPVCAWATLYPIRIAIVETLKERELISCRINELSGKSHETSKEPVVDKIEEYLRFTRLVNQAEAYRQHSRELNRKAKAVKKEIEKWKDWIAKRREEVKRQQVWTNEFKLINDNPEKTAMQDTTSKSVNEASRKLNEIMHMVQLNRQRLCEELSSLMMIRGLSEVDDQKEPHKTWSMGGVHIFNMKELGTANPIRVSASLSMIARIVVHASEYLDVSLPASIKFKQPLIPMISVPVSALKKYLDLALFKILCDLGREDLYHTGREKRREQRRNRTSTSQYPHANGTQVSLDHYLTRKLSLEQPIHDLIAKNNVDNLFEFVEAVSLLAWDIASLCQYHSIGSIKSWDDICDIGGNLSSFLNVHHKK